MGAGFGNGWRAGLVAAIFFLMLAAAPAAPAKARPGRLDPHFGKGGKTMVAFPAENAGEVGAKYTLPFQFTAGHLVMAPAPGGKIVVAGSTRLVRLLANGKPDPRFGNGGSVTIERPAGMTFVLAGIAVDSQGRVLVAGTARPQPSSTTPDPLASSAVVMRFGADGSIDRSFGREGSVITDFGIEPPAVPSGRYPAASVGLRSIAVDSQNRPILTGGSITKVADCYSTETAISTGFVTRLSESGSSDASFGAGGLRQIADLSSFAQSALVPSGGLLAIAAGKQACGDERGGPAVLLTQLGPEGNLDASFGFSGFRSIGYRRAPVATIAPSGKIVLLGDRRKETQLVIRLLPNGGFDPSFGRTGRISIVPPKNAALASVAVDARGRLLFAGHASKRVHRPNSGVSRSTFLLARMNANGNFDRSFGRHGSMRTGFGGPSSSFATQVIIDAKGRILVGGNVSSSLLATGSGFALARYLPNARVSRR
jgi:uncharacterized delta-60 repeat protein